MKSHANKTHTALLSLAAGTLLLGSVLGAGEASAAGVFGSVESFQYAHNEQGIPVSLYAEQYLPVQAAVKQRSLPRLNTPFVSASLAGLSGTGANASHSFWNVTQGNFKQLSAYQEQERSTFEEVVLTVVGVGAYIAIQGANVWASKEIDKAFAY